MMDMKNVNKPIKQESKTLLGKINEIDYGKLGIATTGLAICGNILYPVATATIIGAMPYVGIGMLGIVGGALLMDIITGDIVEEIEEMAKESNETLDRNLNNCVPVGITKKEGK